MEFMCVCVCVCVCALRQLFAEHHTQPGSVVLVVLVVLAVSVVVVGVAVLLVVVASVVVIALPPRVMAWVSIVSRKEAWRTEITRTRNSTHTRSHLLQSTNKKQ